MHFYSMLIKKKKKKPNHLILKDEPNEPCKDPI